MKAVEFDQANHLLKAPDGWTEEECYALPVCHARVDLNGKQLNSFTSAWKPSEEEIADIVAGKPIYLTVLSNGHPPVSIETKNPIYYISDEKTAN